jgi:hypothetical protein
MDSKIDHYSECPNCGKLYSVVEGHDCEYGAYIPAVDYTRVMVMDSDGDQVEIRTENA